MRLFAALVDFPKDATQIPTLVKIFKGSSRNLKDLHDDLCEDLHDDLCEDLHDDLC